MPPASSCSVALFSSRFQHRQRSNALHEEFLPSSAAIPHKQASISSVLCYSRSKGLLRKVELAQGVCEIAPSRTCVERLARSQCLLARGTTGHKLARVGPEEGERQRADRQPPSGASFTTVFRSVDLGGAPPLGCGSHSAASYSKRAALQPAAGSTAYA
ncbi:hypothetical protein PaG_00654 [Moesziomyces aphidis]|uniref:Uncharacterized protein n=1 Tax=Moesziomyces aphidis TaxID=84754 RepID=W3VSV4_MOEAP|nr:hypothetical protein PaG_00654 [Moesziomyces aphidis]